MAEKTAPKTKTARVDLTLPRWKKGKDGKNAAINYFKKCGAYYDWRTKTWYTYAGHRNAKYLARFMSEDDRALLKA